MAGPHRYPYASLTPTGFELLVYSLYKSGAVKCPEFDSLVMSLAGGDGGRDLRLGCSGTPVGIVQCKKLDRSLSAPTVLREVVKFLLNAELDPRQLPDPAAFTYALALSRDPAATTLSFFESPKTWLVGREQEIRGYVCQLVSSQAGIGCLDPDNSASRIFTRLSTMHYSMIRPADLDELLDSSVALQTRQRFFRHIPVIDLEAGSEMIVKGLSDAGLVSPPQPLTRPRRKALARSLSRRIADTLDHTGLYKRGRTIVRDAFMAQVSDFLANDKRIFPVVGLSGVGKTSALAWLAERGGKTLPPRLLVRGAWINERQLGIRDLLEVLPWTEAGYPGGSRFAVEEMFDSNPPLILLDGLNETTAEPDHIRNSWIPNTLEWASRRGAKLIVTCRPEHWAGWQDTFPSQMLHLLPTDGISVTKTGVHRHKKNEVGSVAGRTGAITGSVEARESIRLFQLTDFTESEATEAVAAYQLHDRLSVDQARHPFLLEVAQLVDLTSAAEEFAIDLVLDSFIERRVARALGRRECASLLDETLALLSGFANEMYAVHAQVISSSTALEMARDIPKAINCLVDEHLLLRDRDGFRFQQDQVREHLQALRVTAEDIVRAVRPPPLELSKRWMDRARLAFAELFARAPSQSQSAHQRISSRVLQPSVAARAAVRILRSQGTDRIAPVLNSLFDATDPARTDPDAEWALQTIRIMLGICAPAALDIDIFVAWLKRLLERPKEPWLNNWQEEIHEAIISLLTRSKNRVGLKLDLLPASIGRGQDFVLGVSALEAGARTEIAMLRSHPTYRHYGDLFSKRPSGQLIAHLIEADPQASVTSLITWLLDSGETKGTSTSNWRLSLPDAAAVSLYQFRDAALDRVVVAAVIGNTDAATNLLEALIVSNPDEVVREALIQLGSGTDMNGVRLRRAIWRAFHRTASTDEDIMKYAYDGMLHSSGEDLIWAVRTFFVEYEFRHRVLRESPDDLSRVRLAETLAQIASRYSVLLHAHLVQNSEDIQIAEDFSYLLQSDFETGATLLDDMCASDRGLSAVAVAGIRTYLTPSRVGEEGWHDRFLRLMRLLDRFLDSHGTVAVNRVADFVVRTAERAGMNRFEFDEDTMIGLGFLDLAKRVISHGGDYVGSLCGSLNWPTGERARAELLTAVAESSISDGHFEGLMFSLICGSMYIDNSLEQLQLLRIKARQAPWDEGARRYLNCHSRAGEVDHKIVQFWASLRPEELTDISTKVVGWVREGYAIRNAALAAMHTNAYSIRSVLGKPGKGLAPVEGEEGGS